MGIADHLTCLLRNLYAGQKAIVRTGHEKKRWVPNRKMSQGCILSPRLEYIIENARLNESQAGIKVAGRNINNLRYADDITLVGFPGGSEVKASAWNVGDLGSIPRSGRSPGEGNGNPLQYSYLENPMERGAWRTTVQGIAKSQT